MIDIKSSARAFLETSVAMNSGRYLVLTESDGSSIITRVYLKGQIMATTKSQFQAAGFKAKDGRTLSELMRRQHDQCVEELKKDRLGEV